MQCELEPRDSRLKVGICMEKQHLMDQLLESIRELLVIQEQQLRAVITKDPDFARFDILLEMASAQKRTAKYAYMKHVEAHEC